MWTVSIVGYGTPSSPSPKTSSIERPTASAPSSAASKVSSGRVCAWRLSVPVLARGCLLRLPAPPAIAPDSCSWNRLKPAAATRLRAHNLRLSFKLPAAWPLSSFPLETTSRCLQWVLVQNQTGTNWMNSP